MDTHLLATIRARVGRLQSPFIADVALVALLVLVSIAEVTLTIRSISAGWVVSLVIGVLQALLALRRRSHPGIVLAVWSVTTLGEYALLLLDIRVALSLYTGLALAYSLFAYRPPRVAVPVLALSVLALYLPAAALLAIGQHQSFLIVLGRLVFRLFNAVVVVVAALAWAVRAARIRELRQREFADQARLNTAIDRERAHIATELSSVVVARLRRLVARTAQLCAQLETAPHCAHQALLKVHDEAQQALAAMRRALALLRSGRSAPDPPEPMVRGRALAPTPSGLALAGGFGAAALLMNHLLPSRAPATELATIWQFVFLHYDHPWSVVLLFIQFATLGWWRSAPRTALGVGTAAALLQRPADHLLSANSWLLLVYGAGAGTATASSTLVIPGAILAYLVDYQLRSRPPLSALLEFGLLAIVLGVIGDQHRRDVRRTRRHAAGRVAADMRAALSQERTRIARELHDVLGHYVSAIVVQAGAARRVAATRPDVVREAVGHIEELGQQIRDALPALQELHGHAATITAPGQLDAEGLEQLVAPLRSIGLPVTVEIRGEMMEYGDEVELFAQRILMEALTNVLRHAGPSPTLVRLDRQADAVTIEVTDAGPVPGHREAQDGGGHGLIGMRERAELLGGALVADQHGERGWRVQARLPRPPAS